MKPAILAALVVALAACNPPPAPTPAADAAAPEPRTAAPDATTARESPRPGPDCERAGELFDTLTKGKAAGMTEADALADLSARGDYALGYVVDGVFGDRFGPGGTAAARVDTLAACRRMVDGGGLY